MLPNNHRAAAPFSNPNCHLNTGASSVGPVPCMPSMTAPPCNVNPIPQIFPMQNNCVPMMGVAGSTMQPGQFQAGFIPQNGCPTMNYGGAFLTNSQFGCYVPNVNQNAQSQPAFQLPANNSMGVVHNYSQNNAFPNGPFLVQAPVNPVLTNSIPNQFQGAPCAPPINLGYVFPNSNHASNIINPQNSNSNHASNIINPQNSTCVANACTVVTQSDMGMVIQQQPRAMTCQAGVNTQNKWLTFPQQLQQSLPMPSIRAAQHQQIPNYQSSTGTNQCDFPQQLQQGVPMTSLGTLQHQQVPNCQPPIGTNPFALPQQLQQGISVTPFGAVQHQQIPNCRPLVGTTPTGFPQQLQQGVLATSIATVQNQQIPSCQHAVGSKPRANSVQGSEVNISRSNFSGFSKTNIPRNPQRTGNHWNAQKLGFQHRQNRQGNISGSDNGGICGAKAKRRPLFLNYTQEEIKLWREERKKNYPTRATIERKSKEKENNDQASQKDAESRRLQLKEVLAKQAELGFEVPEIPHHYLSGPDNEGKKSRYDRRFPDKRRFSNRRGRYGNKHTRFGRSKTASSNDVDSPLGNVPRGPMQRQPTLLRKLLASDIRRDGKRLQQVFRFMAINSFFDRPDKPLDFPVVEVQENGMSVEVENGSVGIEDDDEEGEILDD